MNRSVKGLLIVTAYLDGFSLANRRRFAKLSTCQTFPLYSSSDGSIFVTRSAEINHVSVNYTELYFHQYLQL